jgi:hypothetical protein
MEGLGMSLAADLGASGLWNYDGTPFWTPISGWDVEDMTDVDLF